MNFMIMESFWFMASAVYSVNSHMRDFVISQRVP
jgi:hypothetical protein